MPIKQDMFGEQEEGLQELAQAVKELQRSDPEVKVRWHTFCDLHNGGKFDPMRASTELLSYFIQMEEQGGADFSTVSEREQLMVQVKSGQRENQAFKEAWIQYCDMSSEGVRDPAKHTEDSLRTFVQTIGNSILKGKGSARTSVASGKKGMMTGKAGKGKMKMGAMQAWNPMAAMAAMAWPTWTEGGGGTGWNSGGGSGSVSGSSAVKFGQKHSENFKEAWAEWVSQFGNGKRDPAMYDDEFIASFLDTMASSHRAATGSMGSFDTGKGSKRARPY